MASAQHPNRVYFTSLDRSPVDPNTDFTITFDTPIENARNFEVVSAAFPNTFHQFAGYETILYFYHELFQGGATAIGVPFSITQFIQAGATGESSLPSTRPTGRKQYIDQRYFLDGADLATYLTDWIQSLSATGGTNFPASTTGLCPFYFANDDPTNPPTFFANEAATSVNFSTLSFSYDNTTALGGTGSLKLVFADSAGHDVRVASILDFGSLNTDYYYPSLLSYKLGYTDLVYEAFNSVVSINETNNQFVLNIDKAANSFLVDDTNNTFSVMYAEAAPAPKTDHVFTIAAGDYQSVDELVAALNAANGPAGLTVTFTNVAGSIQIAVTITGPSTSGTDVNLNFFYGGSGLAGLTGFTASNNILIGTIGVGAFPFTYTGTTPNTNSPAFNVSDTYTIPTNDYSPAALAAVIQDCLRTQNTTDALYTYVGSSATVGLATTTKLQFTLTSSESGLPVALLIDRSNPVQNACAVALGFGPTITNVLSATGGTITGLNDLPIAAQAVSPPQHLATDPINLIRTSNIYFASSLSAGEALSSAGRKDVLFAVPLTAPIGSVQLYQSTLSGVIVNRPPSVVRNLRVSLLDDNFQVMEAMPQNSSISVEIHFSYDDENNVNNVSTNPYAQKA